MFLKKRKDVEKMEKVLDMFPNMSIIAFVVTHH